MFEYMAHAERIELAKAKMEKVLDHFLYVLELHANNEFVVYRSVLSQQIPQSFAANAFNVFQLGMFQIEIIRLCALWDNPDTDKENITTVVELVDDEQIIEMLGEETRSHWANQTTTVLNRADDPKLAEFEHVALETANIQFGDAQAAKARAELAKSIEEVRTIQSSARLAAVMNVRDKHLAHSLTETRREKKGPVEPMQKSDGHWLLLYSSSIIETLFCWINGKSFSIEDSVKIDYDNAEALWGGCRLNVLR